MLLALSSWFSILAVVAGVVLATTTEDKIHIHAQKNQIKRCESGRSALTILSAPTLIYSLAHNCRWWQVRPFSTKKFICIKIYVGLMHKTAHEILRVKLCATSTLKLLQVRSYNASLLELQEP
jgi:hypothetical protein